MKKKFLIILLIIFSFNAVSEEIKYKISDIPAGLKENAKAVVRNEETELYVESLTKFVQSKKLAITILNENGLEHAIFNEQYNKFSKIKNIRAVVYNAEGKQIKKIKPDEIKDLPVISGYNLFEDNRIIYIDPKVRTFPFTIEYTYEILFKSLMFLPNWNPCNDYNISIENSIYKVNINKNIKLRFQESNLSKLKDITKKQDSLCYFWQLKNFKAFEEEPYSLNLSEYTPAVLISPNTFEIDGYQGDFETWEKFGLWFNEININRDKLPEERINKIKELTKDAQNDLEKIKTIYSYLQNNTRYVSIQIGIGGWQTFDAETVDRLGYGDCKALTNYMKALLKAVGISSYYSLVKAGNNAPQLTKIFPRNQFNHLFLTVPLKNDTIFLECTSQIIPFGFIGDFTDDRDVLLITENGGRIIHTTMYSINNNIKNRKAIVNISSDGNGEALVNTNYKCIFYDDLYYNLLKGQEELKKNLFKNIHIPSFSIDSLVYTEYKERIPFINEYLKLRLNNYATISGNRLFIPLNLMNKLTDIPKKTNERKSDILIKRSFQTIDTITFNLPIGYTIENAPLGKTLITAFGEFDYFTLIKDDKIKYIRTFKLYKGTYPASNYEEFVKFFELISLSDNTKVVLLKNKF